MTQSVPDSIFEQYEVAAWAEDGSERITFPVESIRETRVKRIVEHKRTYRAGAKLDDTDWDVRAWEVRAVFNNTIAEPGLDETPVLYPTRLNALIRSFDQRATGDAFIPTRGLKRCRAHKYDRVEEATSRNEATLVFTFLEDSEDVIDLDALEDPSVRANVVRLSQQTKFSAESIGSTNDGLNAVVIAAGQVETLLNAPGRYVEDVKTQARRNRRALQRAQAAEETLGRQVGGLFSHPESHEAQRLGRMNSDMQGRADAEKNSDQPKPFIYEVRSDTNIFAIAAKFKQDPILIMQINAGRIDNPFDLRPGQRVLVVEA